MDATKFFRSSDINVANFVGRNVSKDNVTGWLAAVVALVVRALFVRPFNRLYSFFSAAQAFQNDIQLPLRAGKTSIQFDRSALGGFGFFQRTQLRQEISKIMLITWVYGVQLNRFFGRLNRFLRTVHAIQNGAQLQMRAGEGGIQFDRPALGGFGFLQ